MTEAPPPPDRWSHDLKNQLGIILGFAELMLSEMDPADRRYQDLEEIQQAATRAMALVAQSAPGRPK